MRAVLEVADIFRHHGEAFRTAQRGRLLPDQRRVMAAIEACRTATLGGHVEQCDDCGMVRIAYNSCRDRHCPKCQGLARAMKTMFSPKDEQRAKVFDTTTVIKAYRDEKQERASDHVSAP